VFNTANLQTEQINAFTLTAERPFVLRFPTSSSLLPIYCALIIVYREGQISFCHIVIFNMDKYVALTREYSESYYSFIFENFFTHINIDPKNINILDSNTL
jgi:glucosamine-6-phosphate deaminase